MISPWSKEIHHDSRRRAHPRWARQAALFAALVAAGVAGCSIPSLARWAAKPSPRPVTAPSGPVLLTGANQIRALATGADGTLWAATAGGVVQWTNGQETPRRWTTADGLQSNDVRAVLPNVSGGGAIIATATGTQRIGADGRLSPFNAIIQGAEARALFRVSGSTTAIATSHGLLSVEGTASETKPVAQKYLGDDRDIRRASAGGGWLVTGKSLIRRSDQRRFPLPFEESVATITALEEVEVDGGVLIATVAGLWQFRPSGKGTWREIALPPASSASHVSALCRMDGRVVAGLYGDGLYHLTLPRAGGKGGSSTYRWERPASAQETPATCRAVTALAALLGEPGRLAVGTSQEGVWDFDAARRRWTHRSLPASLPSADIYAVLPFDGALWAATFDRGLLQIDPVTSNAQTVSTGGVGALSAVWPRGLVAFYGALYARHANGIVDRREAGSGIWQPAFAKKELPRPQVFALATDHAGKRLLIGGWAGWASTDGAGRWEHHWKAPEMAGQVVTAIAGTPDGSVWIGTQKKGLLRFTADGVYTEFHEAHGLTDDWITCIAVSPKGRLLVGTYTGGLLERSADGKRFTPILRPDGFAIRAIAFQPRNGRAVAATPLGVYEETESGWNLIDAQRTGGLEAQTVTAVPEGLWVGTRTGLAFVPH